MCFKPGTGRFLPAESRERSKKRQKERGMQMSAGSHFMGLPCACSSGCQTERPYKTLVPQKAQNFPGKAVQEYLFRCECPSSGSHSSASQLRGTSAGDIPKVCRSSLCLALTPRLALHSSCLYTAVHSELFMPAFSLSYLFFISWM